jgi:uncharacterized RDD family membrane protein YckC
MSNTTNDYPPARQVTIDAPPPVIAAIALCGIGTAVSLRAIRNVVDYDGAIPPASLQKVSLIGLAAGFALVAYLHWRQRHASLVPGFPLRIAVAGALLVAAFFQYRLYFYGAGIPLQLVVPLSLLSWVTVLLTAVFHLRSLRSSQTVPSTTVAIALASLVLIARATSQGDKSFHANSGPIGTALSLLIVIVGIAAAVLAVVPSGLYSGMRRGSEQIPMLAQSNSYYPGTYGAPTRCQVRYAGFGPRLGARLLDGLLLQLIGGAFFVVALLIFGAAATSPYAPNSGLMVLGLLVMATGWVVQFVVYNRWLGKGQTPGMRATNICLVDEVTLLPVGTGRAFLRSVCQIISALPLYLGFANMLWDPRRQTWHDKIAHTVMVERASLRLTAIAQPAAVTLPPPPPPSQHQPAPVRPVVATTSAPNESDHTLSAAELLRLRTRRNAQLGLRFDDGSVVPIATFTLIGREPSAGAMDEHPQLIAIDDPLRSLSKTHLAVSPSPHGLVIDDRQSTNGTLLVDNVGTKTAVLPGAARTALTGNTIIFGDRRAQVVQA